MTVRRLFVTALALLACLLGAGCGGSGGRALGPETEDPTYIEGKKLKRQNRHSEALNAFLKVIETRGMRSIAARPRPQTRGGVWPSPECFTGSVDPAL